MPTLLGMRDAGVPIQRIRKAVLFERLLARLQLVAPDRWLLKGALALDFRFGAGARATNDMDLARADADPDVRQGHARVAAFLDPVLAVESFEGSWDHVLQQWVTRDRKD